VLLMEMRHIGTFKIILMTSICNFETAVSRADLVNPSRLPLRTSGRYIVNSHGERVKWACVNWYGSYSTTHAVGGLEFQTMQSLVTRIVELGFNCVRMMYSTQGYKYNPTVDNATVAANPNLFGKRFAEIFDITIRALTNAGLMVIINNHNSKSGWCCHYNQDEGLWYVPGYPEELWIESLVYYTQMYRNNSLVVGIDLRNEVHDYKDTHLTWGDGNPKTDWAAAATRAGNAVLQANPNVLIVVMGLCFGMELRPVKDHPIVLMQSNRVVYQTHNYLQYQLFEAVERMWKPWSSIRSLTLMVLIILLSILAGIWLFWTNAGRPYPKWEVVLVTFCSWFAFFMLIGAVVSYQTMGTANLFCKYMADKDIWPWLRGTLSLAAISIITASLAGWRLLRERRRQPGNRTPVCCSKGTTSVQVARANIIWEVQRLWKGSVVPKEKPQPVEWDQYLCLLLVLGTVVLLLFYSFQSVIRFRTLSLHTGGRSVTLMVSGALFSKSAPHILHLFGWASLASKSAAATG